MKPSLLSNPAACLLGCAPTKGASFAMLLLVTLAGLAASGVAAQTINFSVDPSSTYEFRTVSIYAQRGPPYAAPVSVKFATQDDTAHAGVDYIATNGVLTINANEYAASFTVPLINNGKPDGERKFHVLFSEASPGVSLEQTDLVITIKDDDEELNGSNDSDFRTTVAITPRRFLGDFFVAPVPASRHDAAGKVWVSGGPEGVAKLNADGSPDPRFVLDERLGTSEWSEPRPPNSLLTHGLEPLLALREGSLLVVEYWSQGQCNRYDVTNRLVRVLPNGRLDPSFASSSNVVLAAEQDDGKIMVVTAFYADSGQQIARLFRIRADGSPDPSFKATSNGESISLPGPINAVTLDSRGRVLVGIDYSAPVRFLPDGTVDSTFQVNVQRNDDAYAQGFDFAIDRLDRIWLVGDFRPPSPGFPDYTPGVIRLNQDGTSDRGFAVVPTGGTVMITEGEDALLLTDSPEGPDGQGISRAVMELKSDGSTQTFTGRSRSVIHGNGTILSPGDCLLRTPRATLALDEAGRILVAGSYSYNGVVSAGLVRLDRGAARRRHFMADYPLPSVRALSPVSGVSETIAVARIRIFRTGDTSTAASVDYATVDATAKAGRDYVATSGRVEFAPLEVQREVEVRLIDNAISDGDREFRVALRQPSAGYRVPTVNAPFTIQDDETGFPPRSIRRLADGRTLVTLSNPSLYDEVTLQSSSDLREWMPVATAFPHIASSISRTLTFEDTNAPTSLRFYRAVPAR